jgi:hypothetical protein
VYVPSGKESACCGALVYSLKTGNTPVMLRIALMSGALEYEPLMSKRNRSSTSSPFHRDRRKHNEQ